MFKKTPLTPWIFITIGCIMSSFGYVVLIFPLNLFEGGVTGLGLIANKLFGLPIGTTSLGLTFIVYWIATKILGKSFGKRSIYATVLVYLLIDILPFLNIGTITNDTILASFYGAIFIGSGMGLVFYYGASTGGSDAFAQIMKKLYNIPIGRSLIAVDFVVLSIAIYFIGMEKVMYSFLFIFIQIKVVDTILNGLEASQKVTIITDNPDLIKNAILSKLSRGVTLYTSKGAYTGEEKTTIVTVVSKKETPHLKKIIADTEAKVFVTIEDVHQVYGEGFLDLPKKK